MKVMVSMIVYREGDMPEKFWTGISPNTEHEVKNVVIANDSSHEKTMYTANWLQDQGVVDELIVSPANYAWPLSVNRLWLQMQDHNYDACMVLNGDLILNDPEFLNAWISLFSRSQQLLSICKNFSAFMVRREIVDTVGYIDHNYWPGYWEDTDFWYRCCLQYPNDRFFQMVDPGAKMGHYDSFHVKNNLSFKGGTQTSRLYFIRKWGQDNGYWTPKRDIGKFSHPFNNPGLEAHITKAMMNNPYPDFSPNPGRPDLQFDGVPTRR